MKYLYLNDTGKDQWMHSASSSIERQLKPGQCVVVEIPDGTIPWIKVWNDCVLLSYISAEAFEALDELEQALKESE